MLFHADMAVPEAEEMSVIAVVAMLLCGWVLRASIRPIKARRTSSG
jgi:hypothetical protein